MPSLMMDAIERLDGLTSCKLCHSLSLDVFHSVVAGLATLPRLQNVSIEEPLDALPDECLHILFSMASLREFKISSTFLEEDMVEAIASALESRNGTPLTLVFVFCNFDDREIFCF
jgi:hypothetical protein